MLLHASCVAIKNKAVLISGPPGSGKSDVALRLIDSGAQLVADDQTELRIEGEALLASPPTSIAGLMEVRHIGLLRLPFVTNVPIALYVDLVPESEKLERLPELDSILLLDHPVRRLSLPSFAASTPTKIRAALLYSSVTDVA